MGQTINLITKWDLANQDIDEDCDRKQYMSKSRFIKIYKGFSGLMHEGEGTFNKKIHNIIFVKTSGNKRLKN